MIGESFAKLEGIFSAGMQKSDHQDDMKHLLGSGIWNRTSFATVTQ